MERVATPRGTYVYPEGTDFTTFDRDLFNVDLLVQQNLTDAESTSIPVIVQQKKPVPPTGSSELASASGATAERSLESIDAASGSVSKASASRTADELARNQYVERVSLDVRVQLNVQNATERADVERARRSHNVTGDGVTVAVLDTGVDETHPAINGSEVGEVDFTDEGTNEDVYGHGTHVAGIITGNDSSGNETMTGVAPDAQVLDVRVLNSRGGGTMSGIIDGMEHAQQNADVISMSLGQMPRQVRSEDPLHDAVNNATASGTPVIAAAGNSWFHGTIDSPGAIDSALAVGATTDNGTVTEFSSRGPTAYGYKVKPELVANGHSVRSADAGTEGYVSYSGTSMATPVVSGTAALVLEKQPNATPEELNARLTSTSDPLGTGANVYEQGNGEVNATDAVGTDVYVTPGTVDFGLYTQATTDSQTITIHNDGTETKTLNATVETKGLDTDGISDDAGPDGLQSNETGHAWLNESQVTVAPGETATLKLTVATNVSGGIYGGRVTFDDEYSAVFGYARAHNMTIEKQALGTGSVSGDHVTIVSTGDNPLQSPYFLAPSLDFGAGNWHDISSGTVTVPVLDNETYRVLSSGTDEETGTPIVLSEGIRVAGDTTATLDEADTKQVEVDTTGVGAEPGSLTNHSGAVKIIRDIGWNQSGSTSSTEFPDTRTVRVSDDKSLFLFVEYVVAPTEATTDDRSLNASDVYHVVNGTFGVEGNETFTVDEDELDQQHVRYYRTNDSRKYDLELEAILESRNWNNQGGSFYRHEQTIHQAGTGDIDIRVSEPGDAENEWYITSSQRPSSSSEYNETYSLINRHPFHSSLWSWWDYDGRLHATVDTKLASGASDTQLHDAGETQATLFVDGTPVNSTTTTESDVSLSGNLSEGKPVRLRTETNTSMPELSERVTVEMNATHNSSYSVDSTPPTLAKFRIENVTADNYASNQTVQFDLTAEDRNLADAQVWFATGDAPAPLPSRDATHWEEANVSRFSSNGSVFNGGYVPSDYSGPLHLAVRIEDESGNSYEMVVENGTRVERLPPTAAGRVAPDDRTAEINRTAVTVNASASTDNARSLKLYKWDFDGDGTVDKTTKHPVTDHVYDSFGTFEPTVEVVDWRGNTDTATLDAVTVQDTTPPVARMSVNTRSPDVDELATFDSRPSSDNDEVASHSWNNSGTPSKVKLTQHTWGVGYDSKGRQTVNLTVTDAKGNENTTTTSIYVGNEAPTIQADGTTVDAGDTATLDASASSDPENHALSYEWEAVSGPAVSLSSTTGPTTSFTAPDVDETRTVELEVTVTDEYDLRRTETVSVEVEPTASGGGGNGGNGGGGGGGGDLGGGSLGGGLPPATDAEQTLEVVVADLEGAADGTHVAVRNASGGESVTADLTTASDGRFTEIEVTPASDANFTFNVTEPADAPVEEPGLRTSTGHQPIGLAVVEHGEVDISSATYTFTVSRERLAEIGADPESVTLFRYEDGEWVAKSTTLENASGDRLTYAGTSDGFSTYAIGAKPTHGGVTVVDADVDRSDVDPGTEVEVTATVENSGSSEASRTLGLSIDGDVVATETVTVAGDGSTEVTFGHVFDAAGEYSVAVNDTAAGTVSVRASQTDAEPSTEAAAADEGGDPTEVDHETTTAGGVSGAGVPALPIAAVGAGLVAVAALVWFRRR